MTTPTSVVTPERYATGIATFSNWMQAIGQQQEWFQRNYDVYTPNPTDIAVIAKMVREHGVKALIIGEDWCPDVWRGLPVLARIAEASGMEVRMFMRDQNKDIMAEFLKNGEFESIPAIVFYDGNHRYLGHWIERSPVATAGLREVSKQVIPNGYPTAEDPNRDEIIAKYRQATFDAAVPWRDAQLTEMHELLEGALVTGR